MRASVALNVAAPLAFGHWFASGLVIAATAGLNFGEPPPRVLFEPPAPLEFVVAWLVIGGIAWGALEAGACVRRRVRR